MTVGRNDPCHCGSGKKYKKCCLENDQTKEISSAQILTRALGDPERKTPPPKLPIEISAKQLNSKMGQGYALISKQKTIEGCKIWLELWDELKKVNKGQIRNIDLTIDWNPMGECIPNWCQDLEMELGNAATQEDEFHKKRIQYCHEFCEAFPESSKDILHGMKRAIAESYFFIVEIEKGEECFKNLTIEFPENVWSFIGWGDMYLWPYKNRYPKDIERAESIYKSYVPNDADDVQYISERLEAVKEEREKCLTSGSSGN